MAKAEVQPKLRDPYEVAKDLLPLDDKLVILRDRAPDTIGRFALPEAARIKPHTGVVLAAGPGRWLECGKRTEMPCTVGSRVIFPMHAGIEIEELNTVEDLVVMRSEEILCVLRDAEAPG
jgi:co-chaperonin GroES (HSP10)